VGGAGSDTKNAPADSSVVVELEPRAEAGGGGAGKATIVTSAASPEGPRHNDCLAVVYTKELGLLGRRFVLDRSPITIGGGPENDIVLQGDGVSREHAQLEQRSGEWWVTGMGSTSGCYVNDEQITGDQRLRNGDRINIGRTILKCLCGEFADALYHEEIYRMTIIDGLTQTHVKRYFLEWLEKEIMRAGRHARDLCVLMLDIDRLRTINAVHGDMAGDHVLKEVARIVSAHVRRDQVLARYGGEEFALLLPDTRLDDAIALGEALRAAVESSRLIFRGEAISVTISIGVAHLADTAQTARDLVTKAGDALKEAKSLGGNRIGGWVQR
jgi:diguanylate cyclase (GGDEF)-like protein